MPSQTIIATKRMVGLTLTSDEEKRRSRSTKAPLAGTTAGAGVGTGAGTGASTNSHSHPTPGSYGNDMHPIDSNTSSRKKPSLMDKLNPKVDADGDGKPGFMK